MNFTKQDHYEWTLWINVNLVKNKTNKKTLLKHHYLFIDHDVWLHHTEEMRNQNCKFRLYFKDIMETRQQGKTE